MTGRLLLLGVAILGLAGCDRPPATGWSELHSTVDAADADRTRRLSRTRPAWLRAEDDGGHTPLHVAAERGHTEVAGVLVAAGAPLEAGDSCGWTPLHMAAANGRTALVELLLARGANLNARDRRGQTPLRLAVKWNHPQTADVIRANGGTE